MKALLKFKLENDQYNAYKVMAINKDIRAKLSLLKELIEKDIKCDQSDTFTDWLDDKDAIGPFEQASGTILQLDPIDKTRIEILDSKEKENGPAFRIYKEEYRKMVFQWQAICKMKPKEIIIIWENDTLTLEVKK